MMTRKLLRAERIRDSRNGNPRWRLTFDDGSQARTRADTAMTNGAEYRLDRLVGSDVALTFDARGYVADVAPLPTVRFEQCDEWQALETGCALDGHYGWHNTYRIVREIAVPLGYDLDPDDDAILTAYATQTPELLLTNGDGRHEWQLGRFTGTRTCRKCGLLPLDADDEQTPCETHLDATDIGQATSELADTVTDWLNAHTVGASWQWDMGELYLWRDCGAYDTDECTLEDPDECATHGGAA